MPYKIKCIGGSKDGEYIGYYGGTTINVPIEPDFTIHSYDKAIPLYNPLYNSTQMHEVYNVEKYSKYILGKLHTIDIAVHSELDINTLLDEPEIKCVIDDLIDHL
jgi:hypothetical protein